MRPYMTYLPKLVRNTSSICARDTTYSFSHASVCPLQIECYRYVVDRACSVKMRGYWPSSFWGFLWTERKSRSMKRKKENEANIQLPSWSNRLGQ